MTTATMNEFSETLEYFKKISKPEKVVPLIGDRKLVRAVLAWKAVIINYKTDDDYCESKDDNRRWEWLWSRIEFDKSKFQAVSGLKVQEAEQFFEQIRGLKLIYPDGSIDLYATQYLNSIIMDTLKLKK